HGPAAVFGLEEGERRENILDALGGVRAIVRVEELIGALPLSPRGIAGERFNYQYRPAGPNQLHNRRSTQRHCGAAGMHYQNRSSLSLDPMSNHAVAAFRTADDDTISVQRALHLAGPFRTQHGAKGVPEFRRVS